MGPFQKVQQVLGIGQTSGSDTKKGTTFDHTKVKVIFVLGGPGVGKGTQCANLVRDYGFIHLSAGDLLRAEQNREGSQYGELIRNHIRGGTIVPSEVTVKLLENAIAEAFERPHQEVEGWEEGKGRFLVDGFPRKMDQALQFDENVRDSTTPLLILTQLLKQVCLSSFVLFFSLTEDVMLQRLVERGKTSGREDDNPEVIKKRFRTFETASMPVVEYYKKQDKVVEIDASPPINEVYKVVQKVVDAQFSRVSLETQAVPLA